ncbi:hypothetical protein Patl1_02985 [Pistacia atlantica]|uniref:Uncharacterized protein n=1 Tax=Pistacia atlantica TaxID=434234 RepID=A0ACC1CA72_9ROSI|nr:hypothetical protein Patl1_02985 [Pistacia atlantica]
MFYSRSFLSRKGPLGAIWVAAYCFKRLQKAQVFQTDIPSSVGQSYPFQLSRFELDAFDLGILEDIGGDNVVPLEEITLKDGSSKAREMQQYSLGKYPFEDFPAWHDTFSTDYIPAEDIFASPSMETDMNEMLQTLIEPFGEQVPEITQSENEVQGELGAEMLLDERLHDVGEEPLDHVKLYDEDHQSDGELTNLLGLARFEKETCLAVNEYNNLSNLQASMEKLLDHRLCQEASVDVEMFSTSKEPSELIKSSAEDHPSDGELTNLPHLAQLKKETCLAINKDNNLSLKEPSESIKSSGGEHHTNAELMNSQEMSLPGNGKCQFMTREDPVSITVDATPQSKFLDASGDSTPGFMVVHTPATKERARSKKKRKCCFDDVTVFPNHLIRQHIEDASDLVSKRRKVRTALTAWKALRISNLSQGFFVPLLPWTSETVEPLEPESPAVGRSMEQLAVAPETPTARSLEQTAVAPGTPTARSLEKMAVAPETPTSRYLEQIAPETPTARSLEQIAPGTPTARPLKPMAVDPGTPSRSEQMAVAPETPILQLVATTPSLGSLKNSHLDTVIPAQSFQITEKGPSSSKGQGFNPTLITETELNITCARVNLKQIYLAKMTRNCMNSLQEPGKAAAIITFEQWLGTCIEVFNITRIEVRMKQVLKSKRFVDVRQGDAYGDILVRKVPQWDQSYEALCL